MLTRFAAILGIAVAFATSAQAQSPLPYPDVNCAALTGTPLMCVKNASMSPVVAVQAVAATIFLPSPTAWIRIPGGVIRPGGTAIVKFPTYAGGCIQNIIVQTDDGKPHVFPNANVCTNTVLPIRW